MGLITGWRYEIRPVNNAERLLKTLLEFTATHKFRRYSTWIKHYIPKSVILRRRPTIHCNELNVNLHKAYKVLVQSILLNLIYSCRIFLQDNYIFLDYFVVNVKKIFVIIEEEKWDSFNFNEYGLYHKLEKKLLCYKLIFLNV